MTRALLRGAALRVGVLIVVGAVLLSGCHRSSNSASSSNALPATKTTAVAPTAHAPTKVQSLLDQWTSASDDTNKQTPLFDRLLAVAHESDWKAQLRAFELSEVAFESMPAYDRDRLRQVYLDRSGALRSLARAALDRAKTLLAQGDAPGATRLIDAVRRLGQANTGPDSDIIALGRIVGQGIIRAADDVQNAN